MSSTRYIVADVFDGLAQLKAEGVTVDLVVTSPPFLALRSYLPADHPDKTKEIGSEPDPATFISTMLDVVEACAEVLSPTGTIAFEFGDTYAGGGGWTGSDPKHADRTADTGGSVIRGGKRALMKGNESAWPMAKSMCLIPELFAASLAYGRNLLDPERTTPAWRIRNTIAWVRTNPPVGALGDKFRPAKSLITVAAKATDRWFDLDAVRVPTIDYSGTDASKKGDREFDRNGTVAGHVRQTMAHPAGAPPLDWWQISPGGYSGSHYAVFPPELLHRPIEAMCPRRVCTTCGAPSRREVDIAGHGEWKRDELTHTKSNHGGPGTHGDRCREATTTGWSTCGCPGTDGIKLDGYHTGTGWRSGIVLDPFGGSGTTGIVATGLSRDAILIDLDARNADLARERLGMFLEIEAAQATGGKSA